MTKVTQTKPRTANASTSSDKKEETIAGSSSILYSFSNFKFEETSSLLPAKPDTSGGGGGESGDGAESSNNDYVYPVDFFPPISAFDMSTEFPAIILPVKRTHELRKKLKSIMLSRPRLSVVVELSDSDLDDDNSNNEGDNRDKVENEPSSNNRVFKLSKDNRKMYRKIVLDPQKAGLNNSDSSNDAKTATTMHHELKSLLEEEPQSFRLGSHTIVLTYQDWTAEEILGRLLLPEGVREVPSAFEAVGHLAHVNLRDELLPYKYLVGKVLLDKNSPRIRTVVNKLGSIDTKYRTFGMEVIAGNEDGGESWSDVLVKEEGCEYRLDFRKVYWNSRLGGEHRRLVKLIGKDASVRAQDQDGGGDTSSDKGVCETPKTSLIVADLMAGIGPFAIPLTARTKASSASKNEDRSDTKKKNKNKKAHANSKIPPLPIEVYANDLNPSSYEYLVINAERNRCDFITNEDSVDSSGRDSKHKLCAFNMDARAFCHRLQDKGIFPDHCIMNLPKTALEFLDAFRGYPRATSENGTSSNKNKDSNRLPRIHVHCFAPKDTQAAKQEIWKRAETSLGCSLDENDDRVVIYPVRDVSPNKNMYCLSFTLPMGVSALPRIQLDLEPQDEPDSKRRKTDE